MAESRGKFPVDTEVVRTRKEHEIHMAIITLTTDLGTRDWYVAAVKASLLSQAPDAVIVDISHHIAPFSIREAAFQVKSVLSDFPLGTVHVIGINPMLRVDQAQLIVQYMGHYFVAADNGIFSLLFDTEPEDIYEINLPQGEWWTFPMKGVFATVAAHLARGGTPEVVARRTEGFRKVQKNVPMPEQDVLKGSVVSIDHFGNVVTNVHRNLFEGARKGRRFSIGFKRAGLNITRISEYYTEVIEGERLAMFGSNGFLLIAINGGVTGHGGSAASLFGLHIDDLIRIEFYGTGNEDRENDLS
ncbi:MAG: SAM-dependent chlorinase/fluorinase [Flavobacteriales bacterium]|nr:SAM-dependent chlorinase/fluorinase [Flavobacteriales bacterium]